MQILRKFYEQDHQDFAEDVEYLLERDKQRSKELVGILSFLDENRKIYLLHNKFALQTLGGGGGGDGGMFGFFFYLSID